MKKNKEKFEKLIEKACNVYSNNKMKDEKKELERKKIKRNK